MAKRPGRIVVAAGTNGAGKSSLIGEIFAVQGTAYFNPDAFARTLIQASTVVAEANAQAWKLGLEGLRRAIAQNLDYSFETTLGGHTVTAALHGALAAHREVHLWYVGLSSPELHLARVRERVQRGGHDIPEGDIRRRYTASLANLVGLMGHATSVHVFDNSAESADGVPQSQLVFRMRGRKIAEPSIEVLLATAPEWSKPVVAAAVRIHTGIPESRPRSAPRKKK